MKTKFQFNFQMDYEGYLVSVCVQPSDEKANSAVASRLLEEFPAVIQNYVDNN